MTELELRQLISEAIRYASVPGFADSARQAAFLSGQADVALDDLEIDSLAAMELCIAVEVNTGVSIAPAALSQIGSLGGLVRHVQEAAGARAL